MIFTKNIDVYMCEDQDEKTAEDKIFGYLSKYSDGYWRWHSPRRIQLNCQQMKQISEKLSELNKSDQPN